MRTTLDGMVALPLSKKERQRNAWKGKDRRMMAMVIYSIWDGKREHNAVPLRKRDDAMLGRTRGK